MSRTKFVRSFLVYNLSNLKANNSCRTKLWFYDVKLFNHVICNAQSHRYLCTNQYEFVRSYGSLRNNNFYETADDSDSEEHYARSDYNTFKAGKQYGKGVAIKKIQEVFKCTLKEAETMVKKYPGLLYISSENITENLKYLDKIGLKTHVLKDNPWLLTFKTSAISARLKFVQNMGLDDINVSVPLMQLSLDRLRDLGYWAEKEAQLIPEGSRIYYMSKRLQCKPLEMCQIIVNHLFLQTLPFERIEEILQLLQKYGVSPKYVLKDVWVFRYNPATVAERLKKAHDTGLKRLKPWMVRCTDDVFSNTLRRHVESLKTLGSHSSVAEYLSQRLQCTVENVTTLSRRYPPLLKVHVLKMKEVLDFIYDEGFSAQQVCQVPRVLCHSLETLQERLSQIRDLGHNPSTLIVLCRSKRQYTDYLNKLKSNQKQVFSGSVITHTK